MNDSTPEDGKPTPFTENAKNLWKKHQGKIIAVCAAGLIVAAVVVKKATEQNAAEDGQDSGDVEDTESVSDSERRRPPVRHGVSAHTRTLRDGRVIPIPRHERGSSSDDEDENEDPGEAAA
ncbi:hypothetical protein ACGFZK_08310 [Streptomyces sp. NPDC048257]|uniref:hypothetical protein n=1 Tax=Streptomyces sp. NPDC048257 TaxID=3365526 RepID=UPI00371435D4